MASSEDFDDFEQEIHRRLLDNDPTARSELAGKYLECLLDWLKHKFPSVDQELICNAATDTILDYTLYPSRFNPAKLSLFGYLKMSADRDLRNLLEKEKRKTEHQQKLVEKILHEVVKPSIDSHKDLLEDSEALIPEEYGTNQDVIKQIIEEEFPTVIDRKLLQLILDGERRTSVYAEVLGIQDQDDVKQRRSVKQHKDRIKKRLERLRRRFHG